MAFTYKEIKRIVRFKEKDNDEVRFSDFELKDAVNEVIRYISNSQALTNADFNEKQRWYDQKDYRPNNFKFLGVPLPDDFLALVAVKGKPHSTELLTPCENIQEPQPWEYKIMGERIYTGSPHFLLVYKSSIPEVVDEDDEIELPNMFKDNFVHLVRMIMNQTENDIMRDAVDSAVQALVPKRRYRNAKIAMPYYIHGQHKNGRGW